MFQQQQRPESERNLPQWQLEELDRQRADVARDIAEHPALWQKLNEIERKLDHVFALLNSLHR